MPKVKTATGKIKRFPYTKSGKAAAKKAASQAKSKRKMKG